VNAESVRGDIRNVHHLLAHLENPGALERNPLAVRFVPSRGDGATLLGPIGLRDLHVAVRAAVEGLKRPPAVIHGERHARRQHAILTRYDLAKEPLAHVARDLGISTRKLYYERRAGMARIAEALKMIPFRVTVALRDAAEPLIEDERTADALVQLGRFDLAAQILQRIIEGSGVDRMRVVACSLRLVHVLCDRDELDKGKIVLQRVRRLLTASAENESSRICEEAQFEYAEGEIAWQSGRLSQSMQCLRRAADRLSPLSGRGDARTSLLEGEILQWLGDAQTELGSMHDAIANYGNALALLQRFPSMPSRQYCELLLRLGYAESLLPDQMERAHERNARALTIASQEGWLTLVARAHANEAVAQYYRGNYKSALTHIRNALPIVNAMCPQSERKRVAMLHARMLGAAGEPQLGLAMLRSLPVIPSSGNPMPRHYAQFLEAETQEKMGEFSGALDSAAAAAAGYGAIGSERGLGMALLTAARAHEQLGNRKSALRTLTDALALLERVNNPFYLDSALTCRARLTGKRAHRTAALELREVLSN